MRESCVSNCFARLDKVTSERKTQNSQDVLGWLAQ